MIQHTPPFWNVCLFQIQIDLSFSLDWALFIGVFAGVSLRTVSSAARQPRSLSAIATFTAMEQWGSIQQERQEAGQGLFSKSFKNAAQRLLYTWETPCIQINTALNYSSLELGTIAGAVQQQWGINVWAGWEEAEHFWPFCASTTRGEGSPWENTLHAELQVEVLTAIDQPGYHWDKLILYFFQPRHHPRSRIFTIKRCTLPKCTLNEGHCIHAPCGLW